VIEIDGLTKRYGDKTAVDQLSFVVEPGVVTGFLGPNGAGKSTTMRMIAGLDQPTSGTVRVNGKHYPGAAAPMAELGILLDARSVHPGLSARANLLALARTAGIGRRRVDEVIELAGLGEVASTRAGGFSLGMGQRLGVAAALLGQPQTVMLDEPVNGLDPDGVRWIRLLLKSLAAEGHTVFVSSHLISLTILIFTGKGSSAGSPFRVLGLCRDLGLSPDCDHLVCARDFQHPGHPVLRTQQHQAAAAFLQGPGCDHQHAYRR
jgi:ABC-2 type transport system ATP-binding protein